MSKSAQTTTSFTTVQAYTLAVITLVIGITVGYFARGSSPSSAPAESAQAAAPACHGNAGNGDPGPTTRNRISATGAGDVVAGDVGESGRAAA